VFVLDEADRMLDMGFIHDVKRVIGLLPTRRQTLFFSATMPREAQELADRLLHDPETVAVAPPATTVEKVEQEMFLVEKADKRHLLVDVLRDSAMRRVLVFSRTKHGANRIAENLVKAGVHAEAIHGNKSQNARERALAGFKTGRTRVLVATDLASRGIDVVGVTHVINYELPAEAESYVHRIGRTARAGASGIALSFCDGSERGQLKSIERLTNQRIAVVSTPANEDMPAAPAPRAREERSDRDEGGEGRREQRGPGRGGRGGHRAFGDRSRGDRPPAPAEHQWSRGDYRSGPQADRSQGAHPQGAHPQGDRPQGEQTYGARPHAKRPYTPRPQGDRPFGGPPRGNGGRRFGGGGRGRGRSA